MRTQRTATNPQCSHSHGVHLYIAARTLTQTRPSSSSSSSSSSSFSSCYYSNMFNHFNTPLRAAIVRRRRPPVARLLSSLLPPRYYPQALSACVHSLCIRNVYVCKSVRACAMRAYTGNFTLTLHRIPEWSWSEGGDVVFRQHLHGQRALCHTVFTQALASTLREPLLLAVRRNTPTHTMPSLRELCTCSCTSRTSATYGMCTRACALHGECVRRTWAHKTCKIFPDNNYKSKVRCTGDGTTVKGRAKRESAPAQVKHGGRTSAFMAHGGIMVEECRYTGSHKYDSIVLRNSIFC